MRACKFTWHPKDSLAEFAQRQALPFLGKARPLKSRDEVVGEPNHFQIERVGCKRMSGNIGKCKVFAYFPNASFHSSAAIIEVPHAGRCQRQVRVPGAIHVTPRVNKVGSGSLFSINLRATTQRRA